MTITYHDDTFGWSRYHFRNRSTRYVSEHAILSVPCRHPKKSLSTFNPSDALVLLGTRAYRRDRPGLSWALAGLPEPSQGSPGWPGGPRGRTSHLSHQTAGLTRTGAIGSRLLSHGVSAVEQTVPVWCLRPSLRPRRRFDRSIGPSESQRAVPKSVRVVRPLPLARRRGRSPRP